MATKHTKKRKVVAGKKKGMQRKAAPVVVRKKTARPSRKGRALKKQVKLNPGARMRLMYGVSERESDVVRMHRENEKRCARMALQKGLLNNEEKSKQLLIVMDG